MPHLPPTLIAAPHALAADEVARALGTNPRVGLGAAEAGNRLAREGPNELPAPPRDHLARRILRQLYEPMAVLLIAAALVSGVALRERADAIAILTIVVLNAIIGLVQEGKAARALEALREMETPRARVVRDGGVAVLASAGVVRGDLCLLAAGDLVPADLRLLEASSLEIDESMLTGESLPAHKGPAFVPPETGVADRRCIAFAGTLIVHGSGRGLAVATGARTELGNIAEGISGRETATPLQTELAALTTKLGAISVAVAAGVFALTLARMGVTREGMQESFLAAVALAVAAVPEGLATVVTVGLALGVRRMAAHGAIVRRLPAVETLGSTTVIATDKTGTLTENRMNLEAIVGSFGRVTEPGEIPTGHRERFLEIAVLCNDASPEPPSGDPVDLALLTAAGPEEIERIRNAWERIDERPFDSERKRMSVLAERAGQWRITVKGAPESVLPRCVATLGPAGEEVLGPDGAARLAAATSELANTGLRILAFADRLPPMRPGDLDAAERDLTLVALAGLGDPVRPEAAAAVSEARRAGVTVLMVTGDHRETARSIAERVGMATPDTPALTGDDLRRDGIPADPARIGIYARVDPQQKLALVEALQARGETVAVTGDGVNDAPALRRAEIGVAMGGAGNDVAREASDMIVTDDNLATIVKAVREGRGIYDNIRKVVNYLVAGNLSEITVVVVSLLLFPALGVPLLPLQLLWVNLLTDGLPALALAADPPDPGLMSRPPRRRDDRLLSGRHITSLAWRGLLIASSALTAGAIAHVAWGEPWTHARATMFTVLVAAHLLWAFAVRLPAGSDTPLRSSLFANRWLLLAVAGGLALQVLVLTYPPAQDLFATADLTLREWLLVLAGGLVPVAAIIAISRHARA